MSCEVGTGSRLRGGHPVLGHERGDVVLIGHSRQPGEDVAQVGVRIFSVTQTGDDQRVENGGALARIGMPEEEPVLLVMECIP